MSYIEAHCTDVNKGWQFLSEACSMRNDVIVGQCRLLQLDILIMKVLVSYKGFVTKKT